MVFTSVHSSETVYFQVNETVSYYLSKQRPIKVCFLNKSKGFDRIFPPKIYWMNQTLVKQRL